MLKMSLDLCKEFIYGKVVFYYKMWKREELEFHGTEAEEQVMEKLLRFILISRYTKLAELL